MMKDEWDTSADLGWMLNRLHRAKAHRGRWGRRKLRLFACACCRAVWDLLPDPRLRGAVAVAERHADGEATREELADANRIARLAWDGLDGDNAHAGSCLRLAAWAVNAASDSHSFGAAWGAQRAAGARDGTTNPDAAQNRPFCDLLRDLIPGPFHRTTGGAVRRGPDATVAALTQAAYAERAFDRLPILADALEDAGSADADLLSHLRGPGPHVRGCWALDLVLGHT